MKSRKLAVLLVIALTVPMAGALGAAELSTPAAPIQVQTTGGYLGVLLGEVPDALRAQTGDLLPSGQGVMIRDVEANSPAANAGLKAYDILVRYGDQKLFSAQQLSHLVRAESPNTTVTLGVLRGGALQDIQVTLGQRQAVSESVNPELRMPMHRHRAAPPALLPEAGAGNWDRFDSMSLKKLEDGSFKAEIQFLGKDGKLLKQEFTGTRDGIRQQILEQRDLPPAERHQLLEALSARDMLYPLPPPDWLLPGFYVPQWFNWPSEF